MHVTKLWRHNIYIAVPPITRKCDYGSLVPSSDRLSVIYVVYQHATRQYGLANDILQGSVAEDN